MSSISHKEEIELTNISCVCFSFPSNTFINEIKHISLIQSKLPYFVQTFEGIMITINELEKRAFIISSYVFHRPKYKDINIKYIHVHYIYLRNDKHSRACL